MPHLPVLSKDKNTKITGITCPWLVVFSAWLAGAIALFSYIDLICRLWRLSFLLEKCQKWCKILPLFPSTKSDILLWNILPKPKVLDLQWSKTDISKSSYGLSEWISVLRFLNQLVVSALFEWFSMETGRRQVCFSLLERSLCDKTRQTRKNTPTCM